MVCKIFGVSFKKLVRSLVVLVAGVAVALAAIPTSALARGMGDVGVHTPHSQSVYLALAASSRFAAPSDEELQIQKMTERRRKELREKRRQWQNQASEAAVEEAEQERAAKESAEEKLNLEEIAEENPGTN